MSAMNRRFLLKRRSQGDPVADDFALVEEAVPELAEGQFLIRNHYASLDPALIAGESRTKNGTTTSVRIDPSIGDLC